MRSVIIDSRMSDKCKRRLEALGFYLLELPACPLLPEAIKSHPDTLICRIGDELVTTADYCDSAAHIFSDLRDHHPNIKVSFTSDTLGASYPNDCALNALSLGRDLYVKRDSASAALLERAENLGYNIIPVKQGYVACTTLAGDGSYKFAVTADAGTARVLSANGVKVTVISQGSISLPPYEYGFIGGACGVFRDKIYFAGDIATHPDGEAIISAASDAGFECIMLSDEPLSDVGGMIFIE